MKREYWVSMFWSIVVCLIAFAANQYIFNNTDEDTGTTNQSISIIPDSIVIIKSDSLSDSLKK